jgi:hypothetical protein
MAKVSHDFKGLCIILHTYFSFSAFFSLNLLHWLIAVDKMHWYRSNCTTWSESPGIALNLALLMYMVGTRTVGISENGSQDRSDHGPNSDLFKSHRYWSIFAHRVLFLIFHDRSRYMNWIVIIRVVLIKILGMFCYKKSPCFLKKCTALKILNLFIYNLIKVTLTFWESGFKAFRHTKHIISLFRSNFFLCLLA